MSGPLPVDPHRPASRSLHLLDILAGKDAGLPARCEVAEDLEGVSGAALVGVNPVLACGGTRGLTQCTGGSAAVPTARPRPRGAAHHRAGRGG